MKVPLSKCYPLGMDEKTDRKKWGRSRLVFLDGMLAKSVTLSELSSYIAATYPLEPTNPFVSIIASSELLASEVM